MTFKDRKRKTKNPCPGCGLHLNLCICSIIQILTLKTRVVLVVHRKELKRTTNTGQLALKSLANSEMRIRGELDKNPLKLADLLTANYRTFLFFPSDDAIELSTELVKSSPVPIQLIVPDGNWRQASKVFTRHPELGSIQKVKISTANNASLHLRTEHFPEGMATLQAIALALGITEGLDVQEILLRLYDAKLRQTLIGRGKQKFLE